MSNQNKIIVIDRATADRLGEVGRATRYPKATALLRLAESFGEQWLKEKLNDAPMGGESVWSQGRTSQWATEECHKAIAELSRRSRHSMGLVVRHLVFHYGEDFIERFGGAA